MLGLLGNLFKRKATPPPLPVGHAAGRKIQARYDSEFSNDENIPLWQLTDFLSAKAANSYSTRRTLKIRSRYEAANNSYFRGIIDSMANDLIGTGPRLKVTTQDENLNGRIHAAWKKWAKKIQLADKLRLMAKAKIQDGEAFALLVNNNNLKATVGGKLTQTEDTVQLDVIPVESDQCTTPDLGFIDYFWVDGIVLDTLGNPIEYHFLRHHPGDLFVPQLNPMVYDRWRASSVCHWLRKDRPGQVRGVPEITPALELFAQLRRFTKATLAAAETAADFAALLETPAPADGTTVDPEPFETIPLERAMMTTLPSGTKMNQLRAEHPATTYEMFVRVLLREIARCLCVPLNIALGDSSDYNYASGRLDHLGYHRKQKIDRSGCDDMALTKIFPAWTEELVMLPGSPIPEGMALDEITYRWHWDSAESIDPIKDAKADEVRLASNTITLDSLCAEQGEQWEDVIRQRGKEYALMRDLNIPITELAKDAPVTAMAGVD